MNHHFRWLTLSLLFFPLFALGSPANRVICAYWLDVGQVPEDRALVGIGVLVRTLDQRLYMGTSPYVGSLHEAVIDRLAGELEVEAILWMGEIKFQKLENQIKVFRANETSGLFSNLQERKPKLAGREISIENSVRNIPKSIRAPNFVGIQFKSDRQRLLPGLYSHTQNPRHDLGNAIQILRSTIDLLLSHPHPREQREIMALAGNEPTAPLRVAKWVLENVFPHPKAQYFAFSEFSQLQVLTNAVLRRNLELARRTLQNEDQIRTELEELNRRLFPQRYAVPIQIIPIE